MRILSLIISLFILSQSSALAAGTIRYAPLTQEFHTSGVKTIDIRTEKEWRETGVVKGSVCLTFFRDDMTYDAEAFLAKLHQFVKPSDKIALICRSGNRSAQVGRFLLQRGFTAIINVDGGIKRAKEAGIALEPYQPDSSSIKIAKK